MPRSFSTERLRRTAVRTMGRATKDPRLVVRAVLGLLLAANLVMAVLYLRPVGGTPDERLAELESLQSQIVQKKGGLRRLRVVSAKAETGRQQGDQFLNAYFLDRQTTYSTVVKELLRLSKESGMVQKDNSLDIAPVEGSEDFSILTLRIRYEGTYQQLLSLVNGIDRSSRLLILGSLSAAPQQGSKLLDVVLELNAFVREGVTP